MLTFPIRRHSYLECDKYTGLVNQQFRAEVPSDLPQYFEQAQRSPHPFTVVHCDSAVFKNFSHYLDLLFLAKYPVVSRPLRETKSLKSLRPSGNLENYEKGCLSTVLSLNEPKK
ncbi:hypothetical protein PoB_005222800 [Plakobranchus ocellatus]|uniref:Uncharacterized protein n=1 Tax=Plakobranchus ocellatus TaxID=259542 RepID=A0AAV4C410_9GAST|nr:hypothetical protein PoB_005222800 [Plakobranchus ocellatus]